jgi:hypothetical protein
MVKKGSSNFIAIATAADDRGHRSMRQGARAALTDNPSEKTVQLSPIVYRQEPLIPRSIVDLRIGIVFC